jgi:asparagine synthase (glutamine-hydrolysing)
MCGIAGFIDTQTMPEARHAAVVRMCEAMRHRGPDDTGVADLGLATLGMRRLAIFDPAHGRQPMSTPDGRFTLVFNGAIYNFRELRRELETSGHVFSTQCDTEVLLAAYAQWGERCVGRLRGMFAFAVWDVHSRSLFLARDPFGIKPLYFHHEANAGRLLFASEIRALRRSGALKMEIEPGAVADYLAWFCVPAPRTIFRGVESLLPGETLHWQDGRITRTRSWHFHASAEARPCSTRAEFVHELRARLADTTRAHLLADVPVGAFLSGGLDSAAIVALMTRASGTRLKTFSLGFDEAEFSEANAAAATARHLGTEHFTYTLTGTEVADNIGTLVDSLDQPTGDGVNTYFIGRVARAGGITVGLSGLGGDELFGGYPSFRDLPRLGRVLPLWRRLPGCVRRAVVQRLTSGGTRARKLADFFGHARTFEDLCALQRRVFSEPARHALLDPDLLRTLAPLSPHHPQLASLTAELSGAEPAVAISAWELRTYMADVLLHDSDAMSMQHSLELRVPFIDRPLIEWLWAQPARFKFTPSHPKSALAEAVGDLLPTGIGHRPKQGFTLPFARWMRRELRPFLDETFSDASLARCGLLSAPAVQSRWRAFLAGNDAREWSRVWSLAVLVAFLNRRNDT